MLNFTDSVHLIANVRRRRNVAYGELARYVGAEMAGEAKSEIVRWDGYAPSPLLNWPALAEASGVGSIRCKYEGARFGIGSFKALGGAYAVLRAVDERLRAQGVDEADSKSDARRAITITTASDGNHGLSVAWGARRAGCRCVVFLHANVSIERQRLVESMGAVVRRVEGNYDDSTHAASETARKEGWILVADTATTFELNPVRVMAGYGLMVDEVRAQYGRRWPPTHIFLQGGCGGLAASVCGLLREEDNSDAAPVVVVVEPERAACLFETARAGRPVKIEGALDTIMSGLSVGEVSAVAWPVLDQGVDFFMTIPDESAIATMQLLARGEVGDEPVEIGDSGVAGMAGLPRCRRQRAGERAARPGARKPYPGLRDRRAGRSRKL